MRSRGQPPSQRQLRVGEEVRHALARVLTRGALRDPGIADIQITVTEVRMSADLKTARVFILPFAGSVEADFSSIVKQLQHAASRLRNALTKELRLRFIPELRFEADSSFGQAGRIDQLLESLRREDTADTADPDL